MKTILEFLPFLWPITGWICGFAATPKWMLEKDPFGYAVILFCGAVVGPLGLFWFCVDHEDRVR